MIRNICIAGGTHGNELTGVYLIKYWKENLHKVQRSSFQTSLLLSNPPAAKKCVRYIDCDLNRQFTKENIQESEGEENDEELPWEVKRARQIYEQFSGCDFIIDIHNTTSNCGTVLITKDGDVLAMHVVNQLKPVLKNNFKVATFSTDKSVVLGSIGKHRIVIDTGPQACGTLKPNIFIQVETIIYAILDILEKINSGQTVLIDESIEIFKCTGSIDFPRDKEGDLDGMIHPDFDGKDWQPLCPGEPMFMSFSGETIPFKGKETVWPVFINEAAYFEKNMAFLMSIKETIQLPAIELNI